MIWSLFQAMQVIVAAMQRNYKYITKNEIDKEVFFFFETVLSLFMRPQFFKLDILQIGRNE